MRPEDYRELPENRHGVSAGCILLPTDTKITVLGTTSRDFVEQQGGDETTFIFLLGVREARVPFGETVEFLEGIFLSEAGQGFHASWDFEQLLREIDLGGWKVVPVRDVLASWAGKVEERMNKGES